MRRGLDDRVPRMAPVCLLLLVDEDHRIACNHAGESEHAQERDEAQGLVREQEGNRDGDPARAAIRTAIRGNRVDVDQGRNGGTMFYWFMYSGARGR